MQKAQQVCRYICQCEGGDADLSNIQRELPGLKEKLVTYAVNEVWNVENLGLLYMMAPSKTIGAGRIKGRKKQKQRIKFLG